MKIGSTKNRVLFFLIGAVVIGCGMTSTSADTIPTGSLVLWLRADQPGVLDDTGHVATWKNHSPEIAQHAVQPHPQWRPRWIHEVESLGGKPALEFDGIDDFLHLPWLQIGAETTVVLVTENGQQTEGGSYWRAVLSGDDDSFQDRATKYA